MEHTIRVYLAGPMRGLPEWNFPAFDAAAERLRAMGLVVYNPADISRAQGFSPDQPFGPDQLRKSLQIDIWHLLYHCDRLAALPGWQHSEGARIEVALARALGMPVFALDCSDQPLAAKTMAPESRKFSEAIVVPEGERFAVRGRAGPVYGEFFDRGVADDYAAYLNMTHGGGAAHSQYNLSQHLLRGPEEYDDV